MLTRSDLLPFKLCSSVAMQPQNLIEGTNWVIHTLSILCRLYLTEFALVAHADVSVGLLSSYHKLSEHRSSFAGPNGYHILLNLPNSLAITDSRFKFW